MNGSNNIVYAGPLTYKNQLGGVVVLFEDLVKTVGNAKVIDTNAKNYASGLSMVLNFFIQCARSAFAGKELAFHGTERDYQYLGLIILFFRFTLGLKYHTRKFGGNYDKTFSSYNGIWKKIVSCFLRNSSVNFFETHNLVEKFSSYNPRTYWLPNYREASKFRTSPDFHGRIVFAGGVARDKGIDQVVELDSMLPPGWSVDIYGPLIDYDEDALQFENVKYKGLIQPDHVAEVLATYDILLLPSFHEGEGYPGVVIEAFSVGVPVVVTRWRALPEVIDPSCGVLVDIKNSKALFDGVMTIVSDYRKFHLGAVERFKSFDRDTVLPAYMEAIGQPG